MESSDAEKTELGGAEMEGVASVDHHLESKAISKEQEKIIGSDSRETFNNNNNNSNNGNDNEEQTRPEDVVVENTNKRTPSSAPQSPLAAWASKIGARLREAGGKFFGKPEQQPSEKSHDDNNNVTVNHGRFSSSKTETGGSKFILMSPTGMSKKDKLDRQSTDEASADDQRSSDHSASEGGPIKPSTSTPPRKNVVTNINNNGNDTISNSNIDNDNNGDGISKKNDEGDKQGAKGQHKKKRKKKKYGSTKRVNSGDSYDSTNGSNISGGRNDHEHDNDSGRPRSIYDAYDIQGEIGSGYSSVVRRAICKSDGSSFAVKVIDKSKIPSLRMLRNEVELMLQLRHPNIVELFEIFEDESHVFLVMEYAPGGELFDRIVEQGWFSEDDARGMFREMCEAVAFLHSRGVMHRDIKPENVLFKGDTVKLADFGFSAVVDEEDISLDCGTVEYVAPEVLSRQGCTLASDVWSLGVILYILLCGFHPFHDDDRQNFMRRIVRGRVDFPDPEWTSVSPAAKALVKSLLAVHPSRRPSARDVLDDPWVNFSEKPGNVEEGNDVGNGNHNSSSRPKGANVFAPNPMNDADNKDGKKGDVHTDCMKQNHNNNNKNNNNNNNNSSNDDNNNSDNDDKNLNESDDIRSHNAATARNIAGLVSRRRRRTRRRRNLADMARIARGVFADDEQAAMEFLRAANYNASVDLTISEALYGKKTTSVSDSEEKGATGTGADSSGGGSGGGLDASSSMLGASSGTEGETDDGDGGYVRACDEFLVALQTLSEDDLCEKVAKKLFPDDAEVQAGFLGLDFKSQQGKRQQQ